MKKSFLLICLLAITAGFTLSAQHGVIKQEKFSSRILGAERDFSIYLPADYDISGKDYPVLYLLHGAWGTHTDWPTKGNVKHIADKSVAEGMALPMIIVMPDAKGEKPDLTGRNMGYFNRPEWEYERYFFEELIPFVEKTYRAKTGKGNRAIAGLSMGGGGTMVYALHQPGMFSSAYPMSGLLGDSRRSHTASQNPEYARSINDNNPHLIIREAPESMLEELRTVRWFIDCGDDDFLAESNAEMFLLMREKKIPLQFRMRDGGHDWPYWQNSLTEALRFISIGFAQ